MNRAIESNGAFPIIAAIAIAILGGWLFFAGPPCDCPIHAPFQLDDGDVVEPGHVFVDRRVDTESTDPQFVKLEKRVKWLEQQVRNLGGIVP